MRVSDNCNDIEYDFAGLVLIWIPWYRSDIGSSFDCDLPGVSFNGGFSQSEEQKSREINAAAQALMAVRLHYK
ncbi:MAG: hypothetical protein ACK56I_17250, partial [bacterium]